MPTTIKPNSIYIHPQHNNMIRKKRKKIHTGNRKKKRTYAMTTIVHKSKLMSGIPKEHEYFFFSFWAVLVFLLMEDMKIAIQGLKIQLVKLHEAI